MKIYLQIFFSISILIVVLSCSTKTEFTSQEIHSKFGAEYIYDWNIDSTHVLAINKNGKISASYLSPLEYFIYNVQNDSIIFKETVTGGNAKWINTSQIQVNIIPGNITDDEEIANLKYKFDVLKKKKITNGD